MSAEHKVLEMLEELGAVQGVRGALIATCTGVFAEGKHSGLDLAASSDIAKTVRRMVVASSTVGVPLEELQINFGSARMLIVPLRNDNILAVMLERDTAIAPVNSLLALELDQLNAYLFDDEQPELQEQEQEQEQELSELFAGEFGDILISVQQCLSRYLEKTEQDPTQAEVIMRDRLKEWLAFGSPSMHTFPLLLDGLAQAFNAFSEHRNAFVSDVHTILHASKS